MFIEYMLLIVLQLELLRTWRWGKCSGDVDQNVSSLVKAQQILKWFQNENDPEPLKYISQFRNRSFIDTFGELSGVGQPVLLGFIHINTNGLKYHVLWKFFVFACQPGRV